MREHEIILENRVLSLVQGKPNQEKDTNNLLAPLLTQVECKLTLEELLKVRPHVWANVARTLWKMGIQGIGLDKIKDLKKRNRTPTRVQPMPLNKVGEYFEGEEGNITQHIEYNNVRTLAILNSGARVSIATDHIWENGENQPNEKQE